MILYIDVLKDHVYHIQLKFVTQLEKHFRAAGIFPVDTFTFGFVFLIYQNIFFKT